MVRLINIFFFGVIFKNYVQALQKKEPSEPGGGECSTLQSDATHLTILPDAQLAALTESEDDSQTEIATRRWVLIKY